MYSVSDNIIKRSKDSRWYCIDVQTVNPAEDS